MLKNIQVTLVFWLKRQAFVLLFYIIARLCFYIFNLKSYDSISTKSILYSFVFGLKFDIATIALLSLIFTLFVCLPSWFYKNNYFSFFEKTFFVIINLPMVLINIPDVEYYKFIGRRTNFEIFAIAGDIANQSLSLLTHFWYLVLIMALITILFISYLPNNKQLYFQETKNFSVPNFIAFVSLSILLIGLQILTFRGGFQEKPLRINQAFVQNDNALGNLALNSAFTFLTTSDAVGTQKVAYFPPTFDIKKYLNTEVEAPNFKHIAKQNVVILILESFGREYMGLKNPYKGYTPFLDSLSKKGIFFNNNYANGRSSQDAVPSVIASIPRLFSEPYITCRYQSNKIIGLGTALAERGYATSFFHGARNGSMGFEGFSQIAGFQKYYGLNQYPSEKIEKDYDGQWGIMDLPFLHFWVEELNKEKKPFLSVFFTLSSHHPYTIPKLLEGKFPKGTLPIHESIGFADYALKSFFAEAQKQPWFNNTLFILTADHTSLNEIKQYGTAIGVHKTPLIFYHPNYSEMESIRNKIDDSIITQQLDIMPSVLDYLNHKPNQYLPFGKSVFSTNQERFSINYDLGFYQLIGQKYYYKMSDEGKGNLYELNNRQVNLPKIQAHFDSTLKAYIQYYKNGAIDNTWIKN